MNDVLMKLRRYLDGIASSDGILKADPPVDADAAPAEGLSPGADVSKAGRGNGSDRKDDDDDDYNEGYMRKHMDRFMKSNPGEASKCMKRLKSLGKAVQDLSEPADLNGAEAVLVDGTSMFKAFSDFAVGMADAFQKTFEDFGSRLDRIEDSARKNADLSEATGGLLLRAYEDGNSSETPAKPEPVRGAQSVVAVGAPTSGNARDVLLQKAAVFGASGAKNLLLKAAVAGNVEAGAALTKLECAGGNLSLLDMDTLRTINGLGDAVNAINNNGGAAV